MVVATGRRGEAKMVVGPEDTARALRSGQVDVLGTPRLVGLCEEACCRAVDADMTGSNTTVGMKVRFDHMQPTPVGATVIAEATLTKIEGRRLTFTVSASDDRGLVAVGKVVRVIVDRDRFMNKCGA